MEKRNSKKTEQPDRKQEKKYRSDLRKLAKQLRKTIYLDTDDVKVNAERGDLKKAEKQPKKPFGLNTSDSKVPTDRGDLKKTEKQYKKVVETHADRGDLRKNDKQAKKVVDFDTNDANVPPDRGDLKKTEKQVKKVFELDVNDPKLHPDREDSERKITKADKPKLSIIIKKSDVITKNTELASKEKIKLDAETAKVPDDRQKVREKSNLKLKKPLAVALSVNKKEEQLKLGNNLKPETKNDRTPKKPNDAAKEKSDETTESKQSVTIINVVKPEKKDQIQRKPIIRTISSRNDTSKIYKAVTFVDQKKKPTMLQIKIPNETVKNPKTLKSAETVSVKKVKPTSSGDSVKEKSQKKKGKGRQIVSPDLSTKLRSPPTEVAKWAPSSINRHTKPYYEAWVNTTLAAISKNSKKDKLFWEKHNILQSFQRALAERPETPELVYENFNDERYTGKIKVKQR